MKKGTEVGTRFGVLHLGDIVKVTVYERLNTGGTELSTYEGELIYCPKESRFLVRGKEETSLNLDLAEVPEVIKSWDAPE